MTFFFLSLSLFFFFLNNYQTVASTPSQLLSLTQRVTDEPLSWKFFVLNNSQFLCCCLGWSPIKVGGSIPCLLQSACQSSLGSKLLIWICVKVGLKALPFKKKKCPYEWMKEASCMKVLWVVNYSRKAIYARTGPFVTLTCGPDQPLP